MHQVSTRRHYALIMIYCAYLILGIGLTSANSPSRPGTWSIVAPILASLSVGTIAGHVTCVTTDATDDACRVVLLLRAIVFSVTNLSTILTRLVLIVTQRSVQSGQLTQLVALELVLAFRDGSGLYRVSSLMVDNKDNRTYSFNDVVNEFLGLVDLVFGVGHDETVQVFFLITCVSSVRTSFALFDGTFAADRNLCPRLGFHLLQSISTGADE